MKRTAYAVRHTSLNCLQHTVSDLHERAVLEINILIREFFVVHADLQFPTRLGTDHRVQPSAADLVLSANADTEAQDLHVDASRVFVLLANVPIATGRFAGHDEVQII